MSKDNVIDFLSVKAKDETTNPPWLATVNLYGMPGNYSATITECDKSRAKDTGDMLRTICDAIETVLFMTLQMAEEFSPGKHGQALALYKVHENGAITGRRNEAIINDYPRFMWLSECLAATSEDVRKTAMKMLSGVGGDLDDINFGDSVPIDGATGLPIGDHGAADEAVEWMLDYADDACRNQFIKAWREGDALRDWPEYYAWLKDRRLSK